MSVETIGRMMERPSYSGPGLWVRLQSHFGPRQSEWQMSAHMLLWGLVLLYKPESIFSTSQAFSMFRAVFGSGYLLGAALFLLGLARFTGLYINGRKKQVTPWVRMYSAIGGFWCWGGISMCFLLSGVVSTWLAIYPIFAITELVNMHRSAGDAREGQGYGSRTT
jgi:hypothetical protein